MKPGDTNVPTLFFCIGTQKSGTTLLTRLFDQHPQCMCINESYWLEPANPVSLANLSNTRWRDYGLDWAVMTRATATPVPFLSYPKLRRLGKRIQFRDPFSLRHCHKFKEVLYSLAEQNSLRAIGDKWPWYIDHIDLMLRVFPEAQFVYNVRDPRGLWNSAERFKDRGRGDKVLDEMLRQDARITPYLHRSNFHVLRYEDLTRSPAETMRPLYSALGLADHDVATQYDADSDPVPERWSWVPETREAVSAYHAEKWRDQMEPAMITSVSERAADFIEKYDYPKCS